MNSALHTVIVQSAYLSYCTLDFLSTLTSLDMKQNSLVHMDQRMLLSKGNVKNTSRLPHATKDTPLCDLLLKQG